MHIAHYRQFIDSIALNTLVFGRPVLMLAGDSHFFRSDNPLVKGAPCLIESGTTEVPCSFDAYENQPNGYVAQAGWLPCLWRPSASGECAENVKACAVARPGAMMQDRWPTACC